MAVCVRAQRLVKDVSRRRRCVAGAGRRQHRGAGDRRGETVTCGASAARKGSRAYKILETVPQEVIEQYVKADMGPDIANTTYYPKGEDVAKQSKQWYIVDANGQTLGRLATTVAKYVRGFNEAVYHPAMDTGAMVVIINAEKVQVSGNKDTQKVYRRVNVGRPGSMKVERFIDLQKRIPERVIEKAVKGMLPKGRLGSRLFHNMKIYVGSDHPHEAQNPVDITHRINQKTAPEKPLVVKDLV